MQELEKAIEEKENTHLRDLRENLKSKPNENARFEQGSAERPLGSQRDPLAPIVPATPPLECSASFSTLSHSRNTKGRATEDAMKVLYFDETSLIYFLFPDCILMFLSLVSVRLIKPQVVTFLEDIYHLCCSKNILVDSIRTPWLVPAKPFGSCRLSIID